MENHKDVLEILIDRQQIAQRTKEMAKELSKKFQGKTPIILSVLKGSWIFLADLVRELDFEGEIEFMMLSSYGHGTSSSGNVQIKKDLDVDVLGRDVLIVEDIVDSGITLDFLHQLLEDRHANSITTVTLLSKPQRRIVDVKVDLIGFEIPDKFVIGYGLDFDEKYRGLKDIAVLRPEAYN